MRSKKDEAYLAYELEKYNDFFYLLKDVYSGVILRGQISDFYKNHISEKVKEWERLGIINSRKVADCKLYCLCNCRQLETNGLTAVTGSLVLKSLLRHKYYLYRDLTTPEAIRQYAQKGTDRVLRDNIPVQLLSQYDKALRDRGVIIPDIQADINYRLLKRLNCRGISITHLQLKGKKIVPYVVIYEYKNMPYYKQSELLELIYTTFQEIFYADEIEIQPDITICKFGNNNDTSNLIKGLQKKKTFQQMDKSMLEETIHQISFQSTVGHLDPATLL